MTAVMAEPSTPEMITPPPTSQNASDPDHGPGADAHMEHLIVTDNGVDTYLRRGVVLNNAPGVASAAPSIDGVVAFEHIMITDNNGVDRYRRLPSGPSNAASEHVTVLENTIPHYEVISSFAGTTAEDPASISAHADPVLAPSAHFVLRDSEGRPEYVHIDKPGDAHDFDGAPFPGREPMAGHLTAGSPNAPIYYPTGDPGGPTRVEAHNGNERERGHLCLHDMANDRYEYAKIGEGAAPLVGIPANEVGPSVPQPVILDATSVEQTRAALFTATLWPHILRAGGPRPKHPRHAIFRGVFDAEWLAGTGLPTREKIPDDQSVTLADHEFSRYPDHDAMRADYERNPRTWIFERVHHVIPWLSLAAAYLGQLSGSPLEVLAAVFDSRTGDDGPGMHWDQWYSVAVQLDGVKTWTIGADWQQVTTRAGDVLLLPEGLEHGAATPHEPGHSRHLVFGLCRHTIHHMAAPAQPDQQPANQPDASGHTAEGIPALTGDNAASTS